MLALGLASMFQWMTELRADRETRCRKCGYILRGITEPRCPECGEPI
jgi:rubrerythrin